jgi:hypothetical protein
MNRLYPIFKYSYRCIEIKWHKPILLQDSKMHLIGLDQTNIFLYKIVAKRGDQYKLIYIGMTEKQWIEKRLYNKDHQVKQQFMKEANNGWRLHVSVGEFVKDDEFLVDFSWAKRNIKIIEKLLIIIHSEFKSLHNKKEISWFSTGTWLEIKNKGFLKDGMCKLICYGPTTNQK